ncbi:MAG TPA: hypothetical protein VJ734_07265, partial [Nitrosospira sp.]|nr:hypothetical protein [Nitrosospira sp.]
MAQAENTSVSSKYNNAWEDLGVKSRVGSGKAGFGTVLKSSPYVLIAEPAGQIPAALSFPLLPDRLGHR